MKELWKDVVGYEEYFQISNFGRVFSKRSNKILKTVKAEYEIFTTRLSGRGKSTCFKIHRLVAKAFIENPLDKHEVNHIDGNKHNNHVDNLEWTTESENKKHAYKAGLRNKELDRMAKADINMEIARNIRKMKSSGMSGADITRKTGISYNIVRSVIANNSWKE